ncbi:purine-cytosine permease family protein [Nesterenkonia sp. K-15-9-6]|uniref:purine-cytosine permease family protein n=1 Tax=Nesterenkonia sp. K-15-9-6 TaxID=3093918 RepID=UPI00404501D0
MPATPVEEPETRLGPAATSAGAARPAESGTPTQPETRGIELIDESSRRGRPGALFWVWAAPNASFLTFTMGAVMIAVLGLSLVQAFIVIAAASVGWILTGIIAVSGPAAGTSGSVISRAMYGVLGNRLVVGLYGWLLAAVYLSLTWSAASINGLGLLGRMGLAQTATLGVVVVLVVSGLTVLVAVYGHGLILKTYPYITNFLVVMFVITSLFMIPHFDLSHTPAEPLGGMQLAMMMTIGFTMLVSTPVSFINSPDMARYLPKETPGWRVAAATALGGSLPGIVFTSVGALIATGAGFDMVLDPMGAFDAGLPGWFFPLFTIAVIVAAIALNAMTTYSASMALQALGIPIRRIPSALIIAVIGTALTIVSVAIYDFTTAVSQMLQVIVVAAGPLMAVFVADVLMRRGRYDGVDLLDASPSSSFWYRKGWNLAGLLSLVLGGVASAMCLNSEVYVGPVAAATGLDLSIPAGLVIAAGSYVLLSRTRLTAHVA